jgi:arylsulfatase A-like enzyme
VKNNVPLDAEIPTVAEMVSENYLCGYYGKWHLGDEVIPQHGFQDWRSIEDYYRKYYSKEEYLSRFSTYHRFLVEEGFEPGLESKGAMVFDREKVAQLPEPFTKARYLGREAANFIRGNCEDPFILYVNFLEPHPPYTGPLNDLHSPEDLPVEPSFRQTPPEDSALVNRMLADHCMNYGFRQGQDLTTEAGCRQIRAQYLGNVTLVDRAVGDILRALDQTGLTNNTIVVYTSDHGDTMGNHGFFGKCVMYEEAVKVPLIIRVPWLGREPRLIKGGISQIDLVPTLLDLLEEPIPEGLHGKSRAAVLREEATLADNDIFIEWNGPDGRPGRLYVRGQEINKEPIDYGTRQVDRQWEQVRGPWRTVVSSKGWKLNLSLTDQCELYDLNSDPYEQENLFNDPTQRDRIVDLVGRIRRWQQSTDDRVLLPDLQS